jgi:hypothetical protein
MKDTNTFHQTMVEWGNHAARIEAGFMPDEAEIIGGSRLALDSPSLSPLSPPPAALLLLLLLLLLLFFTLRFPSPFCVLTLVFPPSDLLCVAAINAAIGKAIAEKSDRYAALTYAVYNVLAKKGAEVSEQHPILSHPFDLLHGA